MRINVCFQGNIGSSNWGLNLLQEEGVIPDIVVLALHCEVLSVRGTCLYVLGLISKTRQGCDMLKQHGWDAVRHSRRTLWPVVPDDMEPHPNPPSLLSSVPSSLSLASDSTSSMHNSESDSTQPSMYIMDDERLENCDLSDDPPMYMRPKYKDRSPFNLLASSRFRNRLLHSLSLSGKKLRSNSDPKGITRGRGGGVEGEQRRKRTVTEPSYIFGSSDVFPIYNDGHLPKSPSVNLETSFVGSKASENRGSTPSFGEGEGRLPGRSVGVGGSGVGENQREQASRERLAGYGPSGGGGGTQFKSRSQSFNTDTTTSGISSMSSSPSRETLPSTIDTDGVSINSVISAQTIQTLTSLTPQPHTAHLSSLSKSSSASLVPPGSSHTLPRRAQSLKSPSLTTLSGLTDCSLMYSNSRDALGYATLKYASCRDTYASQRDALGYATLKRLQQQRIHSSLSHSEALASPAKDMLFTDTINMKTGSLDSRLTPRRFLKALSFASLDKEDLLSPISQTTLQRSSSVRSMVSSATYGSSDDFIGLALPVDINNMFQIKETAYFLKRTSPPSEDRSAKFFSGDSDGPSPHSRHAVLRSQLSITELMGVSRAEQQQLLGSEETGLQEHNDDNCLYCTGLTVLGFSASNSHPDLTEDHPFSEWCSPPVQNHLEVMAQTKVSGVSGCSDVMSQGSPGSTRSTELVLGVKSIPEDAPAGRVLLRKEVLRLVVNLSSSVGTKGHETNLLTIKEKFPYAFDDICLYSEVSYLLAHCMFRLSARRFIQELFQDVPFIPMYKEAESILSMPPKNGSTDPPAEP
ncbi:unnamed protein product [Oncorhynchus mykiss]|uniref:Rapamycin-insensitive companion of mTOR domain-containing protein n=1 Tax=Oncorhynchus mykiss TaxID=8022 RepID=A0A060VZN0_ONCMY|nr:unnamed protein product [Oncorhynchus mykiss]